MSKNCQFVINDCYLLYQYNNDNIQLYQNKNWNIDQFLNESDGNRKQFLCGLPTIGDNSFCDIHKCTTTGCKEQTLVKKYIISRDTLSGYCKKHTCQYYGIINSGQCFNLCDDSGFCKDHKCCSCSQQIANELTTYCTNHITQIKCNAKGCHNITNITNNDDIPIYCKQHKCTKCNKSQKDENSQFCWLCKCAFKGCTNMCENIRFCNIHTETICSITGCDKLKINNCQYCCDHKCIFNGCSKHIFEEDDDDGGIYSKYCYLHYKLNELSKTYGFELNNEKFLMMYSQYETNYCPIDNTKEQLLKNIMITTSQYAKKICEL